ncbi:MAG: dTDP-4-dehydrorhamnose 3,5-epimerase [Rhodomicrobium sp.]
MENSRVLFIRPRRFQDDRGWFSESYSERSFASLGLTARFVQDNHSLSRPFHTVRGLHFQRPPHAQAKLVRCMRGRIFDVIVDIRRSSPTYGRWLSVELSAEGGEQLFVPEGFLHGFLTLSADTEVIYKVTDFYSRDCDAGVRWDDKSLGIGWPLPGGATPALSPKDAALPAFASLDSPFSFGPGDAPLAPLKELVP